MGRSHMVIAEGFQCIQMKFLRTRIGCSTKRTESMMIRSTLQKDLLTIQPETEFRRIFNCTYSEWLTHLIYDLTRGIIQGYLHCIKIGILTSPQTGIADSQRLKFIIGPTLISLITGQSFLLRHNHTPGIKHLHTETYQTVPSSQPYAGTDSHLCICPVNPLSANIKRVSCKISIPWCYH